MSTLPRKEGFKVVADDGTYGVIVTKPPVVDWILSVGRIHLRVSGIVVATEGDSRCRDEEMLGWIRRNLIDEYGPHYSNYSNWTGAGIQEVVRRANSVMLLSDREDLAE